MSTYYYDILPVFHSHSNGNGLQITRSAGAAQDWKLFLVLEYCNSTLGQALFSSALHRCALEYVGEEWESCMLFLVLKYLELHDGPGYAHGAVQT